MRLILDFTVVVVAVVVVAVAMGLGVRVRVMVKGVRVTSASGVIDHDNSSRSGRSISRCSSINI